MKKLTKNEKIRLIAHYLDLNANSYLIDIRDLLNYLERWVNFFDNCIILIDSWTNRTFWWLLVDIESEQSIDSIYKLVVNQESSKWMQSEEKVIDIFLWYEKEFWIDKNLQWLK